MKEKVMSKILAVVLAVIMLLPFAVLSADASEVVLPNENWQANANGEYVITSASDMLSFMVMAQLESWYTDKIVHLAADIDMTGAEWFQVESFRGTLDGHGHAIKGLSLSTSMFKNLMGATIKNLRMIDGTLNVANGTGAVFAVYNTGEAPTTFENVYSKMLITLPAGAVRAAGFVSYLNVNSPLVFKGCVSECTFTGGGDRVGGFVAQCGNAGSSVELIDCVSLCDISAMGVHSGGFLSHTDTVVKMTRCLSLGKMNTKVGSGNLMCLIYQGGQDEAGKTDGRGRIELIDCYGVVASDAEYAIGCNKAKKMDLYVSYDSVTVYSNTKATTEVYIEHDRDNLEANFRYIAKGDTVTLTKDTFAILLPAFAGTWTATDETVEYAAGKSIVKVLPTEAVALIAGQAITEVPGYVPTPDAPGAPDNGENNADNNGADNSGDESTTKPVETTVSAVTTATVTTKAADVKTEEKKGCGGFVGIGVWTVTALVGVTVAIARKKED